MQSYKRLFWFILMGLALLGVQSALAQGPDDTDGDSVFDIFDSCPAEVGLPYNAGCPQGVIPDFDKDGVADFDDYCYDVAGVADFRGCPADAFPDFDADGIADFDDSCSGEAGPASNNGCPEGVSPDFDFDGFPDAQDACPRIYGDNRLNNGCMPDADADNVPDDGDLCPNEAGSQRNFGCADTTPLPDRDGDTIPDPFDGCPDSAGTLTSNGCADGDGDSIPDDFDMCPEEAGDVNVGGCTPIREGALPANRAPLAAANVAGLAEVSSLRLGAWTINFSPNNVLFVQGAAGMEVYDLNLGTLSPASFGVVNSNMLNFAAQAPRAVAVLYSMQGGFPSIVVYDLTSNQVALEIPLDSYSLNNVVISPDGTRLASTHFGDPAQADNFSGLRIWDATNGSLLNSYPTADGQGLTMATYSPDGSKIATASIDGFLIIWDAATGAELARSSGESSMGPFNSGMGLQFSPDGSRVANINLSQVDVYNVADMSLLTSYTVPSEGNTVSSFDFNPDGSLVAIGDGMMFMEGPGMVDIPGGVSVLDAASGQVLFQAPQAHNGVTFNVAFSPDGTLLVSQGDISLKFWAIPQ
jgi:DNA-binding beta-propeller fold protein YncE